jgi:hypothetical protein
MEKKFSTLASEINKPLTFAARVAILIFLLILLLTIVVFPLYDIFQKGILYQLKYRTDKFIILIIIEIVTISGFYAFIKISFKNRHLRSCKIIVNEKGILHYNSNDKIIKTIAYSDLTHAEKISFKKDVYSEYAHQKTLAKKLVVHIKDQKNTVVPMVIDMNMDLMVIKNKHLLYVHFINGILTFRPDLKIDSVVYSDYCINEKTLQYDRTKRKGFLRETIIIGIISFMLIFFLFIILKIFF